MQSGFIESIIGLLTLVLNYTHQQAQLLTDQQIRVPTVPSMGSETLSERLYAKRVILVEFITERRRRRS